MAFGLALADKRNFIRQVYALADPATLAGRQAYLRDYATASLDAIRAGGTLTRASANGHGSEITPDKSIPSDKASELVDWAYAYITYATVDLALEAIALRPRATFVSTDFSGALQ